jgi:uncharacterized protein YraI
VFYGRFIVRRFRIIVAGFSLIIACLLIGVLAISAQDDLTVTITQNAVMRQGPSADSSQVVILRAGTIIRLDGRFENGNWVRGITPDGFIGWISSGTTNITLDQLTGMRRVTPNMSFILSPPSGNAPAPAPGASSGGGQVVGGTPATSASRLNMRSGPGTSYRRVDGLDLGATINLDGRDASGGRVRGINSNGSVGWVSSAYLNIDANALNALPVVGVDTPFSLAAPGGAPADPGAAVGPVVPVVNTAPVRGFNYGGHVQGFGQSSVDWMHRAGMTWVKKQFRYIDGQNPNDVAGMINDAHAKGFRILVGIVGRAPGDLNNPGYFERFAAFSGGVAALGADAIEVWNEQNIPREWSNVDPARYTELLRQSYTAIKNANSNTLVISGALAPTGFFGGCHGGGCDDNLYLAGMASAGASNFMDCVGIHYNEGIVPPTWTSGDPRGNSGHYTRYFRSMMDVYYNAFSGRRPLCFTELGYLSPEGYGLLPGAFLWAQNVTVGQQASWLDQAVSLAARSGRVRLLIIWNVDFTQFGEDPMAGYAMIRPGGGCPACVALGS